MGADVVNTKIFETDLDGRFAAMHWKGDKTEPVEVMGHDLGGAAVEVRVWHHHGVEGVDSVSPAVFPKTMKTAAHSDRFLGCLADCGDLELVGWFLAEDRGVEWTERYVVPRLRQFYPKG